MRLPKGITLRITLLGWMVTLVTLGVFVMVIVPEQKREFELSLESKARGVAVSIRGVAAGAAVSKTIPPWWTRRCRFCPATRRLTTWS